MIRFLKAAATLYVHSILFILWTAICLSLGAAAMYFAFVADLTRRGLL